MTIVGKKNKQQKHVNNKSVKHKHRQKKTRKLNLFEEKTQIIIDYIHETAKTNRQTLTND